jgi:integrase
MAKNKDHHLHKIGDVYYFRTMVNGKQIKKALSSSVTEARRQRDELLKEIMISGEISKPEPIQYKSLLFGEVAKEWVKIKEKEVKSSTLRDYKCAMNYYLLPKFGKTVIKDIGYKDIKMFILTLKCSAKRINNVLVPMRSLFQYAIDAEYIDKNPFSRVRNQKVVKPEIHPLSMDEVQTFLNFVPPRYKNFFVVAFFTGMRFGEMAALDWKHVDFE